MKKIFLSLLMALSLVGINCAKAQTQTPIFMGVWVLQNPEVAAVYSVVTFYENGIVTEDSQNSLTGERNTGESSWSFDSKTRVLTITQKNGNSYRGKILPLTNSFHLYNGDGSESDFIFAKPGSSQDNYATNAKMAITLYGDDASLKKNGFATSSRATGFSTLPRNTTCGSCFGLGRCTFCNGLGSVTYNYRDYNTCPSCGGTGICWQCHGTGKLKNY